MASVADTLITKWELQDNYSPKAKKAAQATDNLGKSLNQVTGGGTGGGGIKGMVSGLGTLAGMSNPVTIGITAIATGLIAVATATIAASVAAVKFGMEAMKAAAPMDTIQRVFAGVYGDTKKAAQMMTYLKDEAMKSNFEFKDLAGSAKLLVMNGMKFTEFKDSMQAIAMRGPGNPAENLRTIAEQLTRIKGGDFGRAFEELRNFGISKQELTALGATFDKSGQFTGNIKQALELFKKVGAQGKAIVDQMEGGMEATLSNMDEGFDLMQQQVGKQLFTNMKPLIDNIITVITNLMDSGVLKDTVDMITSLFDIDPSSDGLAKLAIGVLAAIQTGAQIVHAVWAGIMTVVNAVAQLLHTKIAVGGLTDWTMGQYDRNYNTLMNTYNANQVIKDKDAKKGKKGAVEPDNPKAKTMVDSPIMAIAKHTKDTAENTKQLNARHILGGGDIGRMGISPAELDVINTRVRHSGKSNTTIKVIGFGKFDGLMQEAFMEFLTQAKRQGAL